MFTEYDYTVRLIEMRRSIRRHLWWLSLVGWGGGAALLWGLHLLLAGTGRGWVVGALAFPVVTLWWVLALYRVPPVRERTDRVVAARLVAGSWSPGVLPAWTLEHPHFPQARRYADVLELTPAEREVWDVLAPEWDGRLAGLLLAVTELSS